MQTPSPRLSPTGPSRLQSTEAGLGYLPSWLIREANSVNLSLTPQVERWCMDGSLKQIRQRSSSERLQRGRTTLLHPLWRQACAREEIWWCWTAGGGAPSPSSPIF
ncbi:hypothetical protein ZWY2020_035009 [Hordeum vulgare]|nr:hypothetical protein ZWY2020_035009 [Hordeum vulgare]